MGDGRFRDNGDGGLGRIDGVVRGNEILVDERRRGGTHCQIIGARSGKDGVLDESLELGEKTNAVVRKTENRHRDCLE